MTNRPLRAAIAAVLVLLCAVPPRALAQEEGEAPAPPQAAEPEAPARGRVEGRVLGKDGQTPVAGAVIRAVHLRTAQTLASTPTDAKGAFALEAVPYGYVDVAVETAEGGFVGNQVVNVPPDGRVEVTLVLIRNEDMPEGWWSGRQPKTMPGTDQPAIGVATVQPRGEQAFWRSRTGIGILAGAGALALLALVGGGGGDDAPASPSTP
jgi:hypothetical protein